MGQGNYGCVRQPVAGQAIDPMNTFKSTLLLVSLMLVLIFVGDRIGGENGMILAFVLSVAMNFTAYFYSDKIALSMYRAQPVTREQLPRAYEVVERLAAKDGIPVPKIYVIPTESPNAFATGRNPQHASVAVTHGILNLLTDEELEGVLAHELGHVKNRDILTSSIAATLAGAITLIARMGYWASLFGGGRGSRDRDGGGIGALLMLIVAPIAATLDPTRHLAFARVRGRRHRRAYHRQSLRPGARAAEDRGLRKACSVAGIAFDGASVHHRPADRWRHRQPLLYAPPDQRAHSPPDWPRPGLVRSWLSSPKEICFCSYAKRREPHEVL